MLQEKVSGGQTFLSSGKSFRAGFDDMYPASSVNRLVSGKLPDRIKSQHFLKSHLSSWGLKGRFGG